jgi:hypothetical protein
VPAAGEEEYSKWPLPSRGRGHWFEPFEVVFGVAR